jgi:hypothetical protein
MRKHLLSLAVAITAAAAAWAMVTTHAAANGRELFDGRRHLNAHTPGHAQALPAAATRCINCHEGAGAMGPQLSAASLTQPEARRGGPPSRYDESAFCRALREGTDAAWVQLHRAMPRYAIAEPECQALWAYLSTR